MRLWIIAAAALAAACASGAPAPPSAAASAAPEANYAADARSSASDAEVRDARRAYRAACEQREAAGYCECMTGGMAQALAPADLALATAAFTGQEVAAPQEAVDRVSATRAEVDRGCAQFRRG